MAGPRQRPQIGAAIPLPTIIDPTGRSAATKPRQRRPAPVRVPTSEASSRQSHDDAVSEQPKQGRAKLVLLAGFFMLVFIASTLYQGGRVDSASTVHETPKLYDAPEVHQSPKIHKSPQVQDMNDVYNSHRDHDPTESHGFSITQDTGLVEKTSSIYHAEESHVPSDPAKATEGDGSAARPSANFLERLSKRILPDTVTETPNELSTADAMVARPFEGYFDLLFQHQKIARRVTMQKAGHSAPLASVRNFSLNAYGHSSQDDMESLVEEFQKLIKKDNDIRTRSGLKGASLGQGQNADEMDLAEASDEVLKLAQTYYDIATDIELAYSQVLSNQEETHQLSSFEIKQLYDVRDTTITTNEKLVHHVRYWLQLHVSEPLGAHMKHSMAQLHEDAVGIRDKLIYLRDIGEQIYADMLSITHEFDPEFSTGQQPRTAIHADAVVVENLAHRAIGNPGKRSMVDFLVGFWNDLADDSNSFIAVDYDAWLQALQTMIAMDFTVDNWVYGTPKGQPKRDPQYDGDFMACPTSPLARPHPPACLPRREHVAALLNQVQRRQDTETIWFQNASERLKKPRPVILRAGAHYFLDKLRTTFGVQHMVKPMQRRFCPPSNAGMLQREDEVANMRQATHPGLDKAISPVNLALCLGKRMIWGSEVC